MHRWEWVYIFFELVYFGFNRKLGWKILDFVWVWMDWTHGLVFTHAKLLCNGCQSAVGTFIFFYFKTTYLRKKYIINFVYWGKLVILLRLFASPWIHPHVFFSRFWSLNRRRAIDKQIQCKKKSYNSFGPSNIFPITLALVVQMDYQAQQR